MRAARTARRKARKTSRVRPFEPGVLVKARNRGVKNPRQWKPAENLPRAVEALRRAKRILLTLHRGPDHHDELRGTGARVSAVDA